MAPIDITIAFDLVDGHRVRRPVVELRRLGRGVPGDLLRVLPRPSVREVRREVRRPPRTALIMAKTTRRVNARPVRLFPVRSTLFKTGAFLVTARRALTKPAPPTTCEP